MAVDGLGGGAVDAAAALVTVQRSPSVSAAHLVDPDVGLVLLHGRLDEGPFIQAPAGSARPGLVAPTGGCSASQPSSVRSA